VRNRYITIIISVYRKLLAGKIVKVKTD